MHEPARQLPVFDEYDVVVMGGCVMGHAAGTAATMLLTMQTFASVNHKALRQTSIHDGVYLDKRTY
jgi:hypothetical protein